MRIRTFIPLLFAFVFSTAVAQKTAIFTHNRADFDKAIQLYQAGQYQSASILFDNIYQALPDADRQSDLAADCSYYAAISAVKLQQLGADAKILKFLKEFPTSSKHNEAYTEVAHYYFNAGNYEQALEWFDKVDEGTLSADDSERFSFQKGYCYFVTKNKKEAQKYFNRVANSKTYGKQAKYYLGFIAYESEDYKEATRQFEQVGDDERYKEKMSYFQADMNFKQGKFEKAIEEGNRAMAKSTAGEKSELNKIIGESYFNLKKYQEAIPYLSAYKGKKGKWSNTDYYMLGYAYYQQKDYENAIGQFNKIINGNDFVSQNAYYHLGESYLKTDKKQQALNAFKNASEMEFDLKIQEDAYLNYAKLSYEIGNSYQPIPDVLAGFLQKYPTNPNKPEIETLLINSFITSKNYKGALELLERNKSFANKQAYQKVTFYRGLELYTDGDYQEALSMFEKSINEPRDAKFTARATFWKGETQYVLDRFNESLLSFREFQSLPAAKETPEFKNLDYNLGYAYFKLKEYEQAGTYFEQFTTKGNTDKVRLNDAYLRLGDSRFVSAKYWPAMDAYNKAIDLKGVDADYAAFQKAISYGFVSKNDRKIEDLSKFVSTYPKSQYRDDALYELGNTYLTEKKTEQAVATYDKLLADYKDGTYSAKAVLKQGLVYYNADKDNLALAKFKKVAADYPSTSEALEAVSTARIIYLDSGRIDEYAAWVKTLSFVEVTDAELDNDTYAAAEKQYLQGNNKQAISGFTGYLAKFPNGISALKANFYLGQLYYADKLEQNAIPNYEYVIDQPKNEFTEQALVRLSETYLKAEQYAKAVPVLEKLKDAADYPQNKTFAQANLMKSYYNLKEYPKAVSAAEVVLQNPKIEDKVKADAQIIIARAAFQSGDEVKAKAAYAKLQTIAKGELAAEALYYDVYFKNKEGKFEDSNKAVQKLTKDYSGYRYYGAKALVVMAKNFYGLKDSFNATYILENVVKNFTEFEDVTAEAKAELEKITAEEAKTNSSVKE